MDGGTFAIHAFGPCSVSRTEAPPIGAGPSNVTVRFVVRRPRTTCGLNEIETTFGALTVRFVDAVAPLTIIVPVMVTVSVEGTVVVVIGKLAVVCPAGTTTGFPPLTVTAPELSGGLGNTLDFEMLIGTPPAGAWPERVTVNVAGCPPRRLPGLTLSEKLNGLMVSVLSIGTPPRDAEIVAISCARMPSVPILKLRSVLFAATRT